MFLLDSSSKEPIFIQIQNQIVKFIEAGVLKPGDRLPSVRQLAQDNGINPNTAARAYSELENRGVVYNVPKKGVYVKDVNVNALNTDKVRQMIKEIYHTGFAKEDLIKLIEQVYGKEEDHAEN